MEYVIVEEKKNNKGMTSRDFFKAIANNETIGADYREYAKNALRKLDDKNAAHRDKASKADTKKGAENKALKSHILNALSEVEIAVSPEIAEKVEISTQKASALLRQLVEEGCVSKREVTVKGKGKLMGYSVIKGE